jgi:hypothetical protein
MPLRFLLGIISCFATIAAGLVRPTWYAPVIVQIVCFLLFLYAIKLATCTPSRSKFPFIAFVFAAMYVLLGMGTFVWTPTGDLIHHVSEFLHPPPPTTGKPVLFDSWNVWFNIVARFGVALCAATATFFATAVFSCGGARRADRVAEQ